MENRNLETLAQGIGPKKNNKFETVLELTAEGNSIPSSPVTVRKKQAIWMKRKSRPSLIWTSPLTALQDRKETVLAKIEAQGKLTDQLKAAIEAAEKLADVEELYLLIRKTPHQGDGCP